MTNKYTVNGFTNTRPKIAEHFGINYGTLIYRLKSGKSIEEAVNFKTKR